MINGLGAMLFCLIFIRRAMSERDIKLPNGSKIHFDPDSKDKLVASGKDIYDPHNIDNWGKPKKKLDFID